MTQLGRYCDGNQHWPAFLKTRHTVETFHRLGKYFLLQAAVKQVGCTTWNVRYVAIYDLKWNYDGFK